MSMFSMPPAMALSSMPSMTSCAAEAIALRAGAADAVDRHGGNIDRYAAMDGGLPRRIHFVAGLDHIAHHDCSDFRRIEFRAGQHRLDGHRAQVRRRYGFQAPVIGSDRGPHGFTKDDFTRGHFFTPFEHSPADGSYASIRTLSASVLAAAPNVS